jgi:ADP-heptose:LPS heptosyltransferase
MTAPVQNNFLERTRHAKKVMVLDLGFLGDTVHLLPALWMVRQAYPRAELHVGVAAHVAAFMECVPWADRVWGYPRFPKHASLKENLDFVRRMRRERFDVLINLNGSDRSSWLTFLSGRVHGWAGHRRVAIRFSGGTGLLKPSHIRFRLNRFTCRIAGAWKKLDFR